MKHCRKLVLVLGALALGLLAGCAPAASPPPDSPSEPAPSARPGALTRITERGVLRVGMSGEQPPLNMVARSGELFGLEVAVVRVLAQAMGVETELVRLPFAELLPALEAGDVDLVASGMTINPARIQRVAMIGPYYTSGKSLLTRSAELAAVDNVVDLDKPGLRVAALRGSTSEDFVARSLPSAVAVLTDTPDQAIQLVVRGEVDAMVADRETCRFAALRLPDAGLLTSEAAFTLEPMGIAAPLDEPRLASLLQTYLDALEANGGLERMRKVWFEDSAWVAELRPTDAP